MYLLNKVLPTNLFLFILMGLKNIRHLISIQSFIPIKTKSLTFSIIRSRKSHSIITTTLKSYHQTKIKYMLRRSRKV